MGHPLSAILLCILFATSLVLIRRWSAVSPYASHMICTAITVGCVGKMAYVCTKLNVVHTDNRQFVEGPSSDPLDRIIAAADRHTHLATAAMLCLVIFGLVQNLMPNAGFPYTQWIGLTNCTLPVGGVVATGFSPRSLLALHFPFGRLVDERVAQRCTAKVIHGREQTKRDRSVGGRTEARASRC